MKVLAICPAPPRQHWNYNSKGWLTLKQNKYRLTATI